MSVTYHGFRHRDGTAEVRIETTVPNHPTKTRKLPLRLDIDNHSPTGFEWGYGGSGPAQLALAMLADALGNDLRALRIHQDFKFRVIAGLDQDREWFISADMVRQVAEEIEREAA